MKKWLMIIGVLAVVVAMPLAVLAQVDVQVRVNVPLPPPIVFPAPPQVVVIPETYVYAALDIDADLFFYGGWWYRPWEGRWYRSRQHDHGWVHYPQAPKFYKNVPPGWRKEYREGRWKGHEWEHHRVSHRDVEKNWRGWEQQKHWEKEQTWGVKGLEPKKHKKGHGKQSQHKTKK